MQNTGKGLSIAGLVLGIVATVLAWFYMVNIAALVLGIVGIILAVKGRKAAIAVGAPTGLGTAGLALSIIGTCLAGIGFFSCTLCVLCAAGAAGAAGAELEALGNELDALTNELNNLIIRL